MDKSTDEITMLKESLRELALEESRLWVEYNASAQGSRFQLLSQIDDCVLRKAEVLRQIRQLGGLVDLCGNIE